MGDHNCICQEGYCAMRGKCFPTVGKCELEVDSQCPCQDGQRCNDGKCLCQQGSCAWQGKCMPVTDTGGTCSWWGCNGSRGPTTCKEGKCICNDGFVAMDGRCERLRSNVAAKRWYSIENMVARPHV